MLKKLSKQICLIGILGLIIALTLPITSVQAGMFGGGISGPMPVYNVDKTVDAATLATQINTAQQLANQYQQLQHELANLAAMDPAAAAANAQYIQQTLQDLQYLQQQMAGFIMDYTAIQQQWDQTYKNSDAIASMTGADYANQAQLMRRPRRIRYTML